MKYQDLMVKLSKKEISSVYLFSGEETYLKEEAIKKITEILLNSANKEFNYNLVYGDEHSAQTIIEIASSLPFLSAKRLLVIKRVEKFKNKEQQRLLTFLQNPPPTTCIIFVTTGKVNLKTDFYSELSEIGESVVFWKLFENQIPLWIKDRLKQKGKIISPEAISYLQETIGDDLMELANQIENLLIYIGEKRNITLETVREITPDVRIWNIYKMIDAIGEKKKGVSLKILNRLLQEGEEPVKLLGSITHRFRKFLEAKTLLEKKLTLREVTARLEINTFLDKNFVKQINNFSKEKLLEGFKNILKADKNLKTGKQNPQLILELLILRLCE